MYTKNALIERINGEDVRRELRHRLLDVEVTVSPEAQASLLRVLMPHLDGRDPNKGWWFNWLERDTLRFPAPKTKWREARAAISGFRSAWTCFPRMEFGGYFLSPEDCNRETVMLRAERLFDPYERSQLDLVGQPARYEALDHTQRNGWLWLHKFTSGKRLPVTVCPTCGHCSEWKSVPLPYRCVAFVVGHSDTLVQADWLIFEKKEGDPSLLGTD